MKQYGLKLDAQKPEDYVFGASLPFEQLQFDGDWTVFLPMTEFQDLNGIEPYACVTFTILNCVEILIKRKYGLDVNYSDRFLAYASGTKEGGNSPHIVCEFLRKIGVVTEDKWPFNADITSFEKFYEPLPPKLYELARDFTEQWDFRHEFVQNDDASISKALQCSPLLVSVSAWYQNEDGLFYRPEGIVDNHATTLVYERQNEFRRVFDSYDKPYIKDLRWQDRPMQIKRFWIQKKAFTKLSWWRRLLANFRII